MDFCKLEMHIRKWNFMKIATHNVFGPREVWWQAYKFQIHTQSILVHMDYSTRTMKDIYEGYKMKVG